jgi:hypothetical protein
VGGDGSGPLLRGLAQVLGLDLAGDDGHDELDLIVRGPSMLRALGGGLISDNFSLLCGDEMPDCPYTIAPLTPLLVLLSSISKSSTSFLTFAFCLYLLMFCTNIDSFSCCFISIFVFRE